MSTDASVSKQGKKPKPETPQTKRIKELQKIKSAATDKNPFPDALNAELKALVASERKLTLARLANGRVNKLVDLLRQIGNLGVYKPSAKQTAMTFDVIKKAVESAYAKWDVGSQPAEEKFNFVAE